MAGRPDAGALKKARPGISAEELPAAALQLRTLRAKIAGELHSDYSESRVLFCLDENGTHRAEHMTGGQTWLSRGPLEPDREPAPANPQSTVNSLAVYHECDYSHVLEYGLKDG